MLGTLAKTLFMQFVLEPKMQELINKCIYNGHTWHCESLANLAHMYQPKRIVFGVGQQNLMILAKLDMNEQRATRFVVGYTKRDKKSGMRRLAQKDTAYMEPRLSAKTDFFRQEAVQRLQLELVDRNATLPPVAWPAAFAPVAMVPPQRRPVAGQLPVELEVRRAVPRSKASIIGPLVGVRGSLHELVLKKQPQDWCNVGTKQPLLPPPLTSAAVLAKLDRKELHPVVLCCPACQDLLSVELPEGMTQVRCDSCGAAPLYTPVAPPKEERKPGRRNSSHHAPPLNPKQAGRPPTAYNNYISGEMQLAGDTPSRNSFSQAAQSWHAARDAAAIMASARTAGSGQPRQMGRFGVSPNRFVRAASGRRPAAPFYKQARQAHQQAQRAQPQARRAQPRPVGPQPQPVMGSPLPRRGSVRRDTGLSAGGPSADGMQPASAEKAASAQRSSKGPRSAVCCPNGHPLTFGLATGCGLSAVCDGCGQSVADGDSIYMCESCEHDKCMTCAGPSARRRGGRRIFDDDADAPAAPPAAVAPALPPAVPAARVARAAPDAPDAPADAPAAPATAPAAPAAPFLGDDDDDADADDDGVNMNFLNPQQLVPTGFRGIFTAQAGSRGRGRGPGGAGRGPRPQRAQPLARAASSPLEPTVIDEPLDLGALLAARDQLRVDREAAQVQADTRADALMPAHEQDPTLRRIGVAALARDAERDAAANQ